MLQPIEEFNISSSLLKPDKNEAIFRTLGKNCKSLNTAVVRIDKTEEACGCLQEFTNKHTCVLCFVRDIDTRSYFIRAYCLINLQLIWEHELYDELKINQIGSLQLTFKGKNGQMDLNFLSKDECNSFYNAVENRNKSVQLRGDNTSSAAISHLPDQFTPCKKKNVNKIEISDPFDPRCLVHMGWDNTVLSYFLQKAGISEQQINDRNTKKSIYEFINRQSKNVLDTVKIEIVKELEKNTTTTMPPPPPPPPPPPIVGLQEHTPASNALPKTKTSPTSLPPVPDLHNEIMKSIQDGVKLKKTPYSKRIEEYSLKSMDDTSKSVTKTFNKESGKDNLDQALQTTNEYKLVNENVNVIIRNHSENASCLNSIHDTVHLTTDSSSKHISSVPSTATNSESDQCKLSTNSVVKKDSCTDDLINALHKTLKDRRCTQLSDDESTDSEWDD